MWPVRSECSGGISISNSKSCCSANQEPDNAVLQEDLFAWVEHSNFTVFKRSVLEPLHKKRLIEYDKSADTVTISPLGIKEVEHRILKPAVN